MAENKKFLDEEGLKVLWNQVNLNDDPNNEVLNTFENSKIYRTDVDGSIMFKFKNNKLKIETCAP